MINIIVGIHFDFVCNELYNFTLLYNETSNRLFSMAYRYNSIFITINIFIVECFINITVIVLSSQHCQKLQKTRQFSTPSPLHHWTMGTSWSKQNFLGWNEKKYFATHMCPFTNYYYTDSFEFMCVHTCVNMSGHVSVWVKVCASVFAYMWFKDFIRFDRRLNKIISPIKRKIVNCVF